MQRYRDAVAYGSLGGSLAVISRGVFWGLLGTVLLSPLPFGSILPWAYTLLAVIVAVLVLVWSVTIVIAGDPPPVTLGMIRVPALLFFGVVVWAAIQAAPWTPAAWHNPVWAETAAILGTPVQGYISVLPHATETSIMRLLTYAGIFWLALQFGRSSARANQVFYAVAIAGLVYAAYGLLVEFTGAEKILWYEKEKYKDSVTSTLRYKNAYATYAGMGLICTVTLLVRVIGREDFSTMGPRQRLRSLLLLLFEKSTFLIIGFVLITAALLLSNSRAGFIAAIIALLTFALASWKGLDKRGPYGRSAVIAILLAGVAFVGITGGKVIDRLGHTSADNIRSQIYTGTVDAIAEHPLKGWGFGSFESVFAQVMDIDMRTQTVRAHNEYLDNALGLGIPATAALVLAVALLGIRCVRGSRTRQRDTHFPAAGAAITALVGLHSVFDFTMQTPAVAATFALLLGTCTAQSWSSLVRRVARTGT